MKKLLISASRSYEVLVERGLLDRSGELIKAAAGSKKRVMRYPSRTPARLTKKSVQSNFFAISRMIISPGTILNIRSGTIL